MPSSEASKTRRIELILRQIDSLPTLPVVAARLLALTASDESTAHDIMEVVSADQTLTAKILALCRQSDRGIRNDVMTVNKAVVLLGFNAIRNAVLSVKVVGMFEKSAAPGPAQDPATAEAAAQEADSGSANDPPVHSQATGGEPAGADGASPEGASQAPAPGTVAVANPPAGEEPGRFDRVNFWRHSLAVAIAAEMLASAHPNAASLPAGEAFVCGLLHDIGKLALDFVLPKSFARVVDLTDLNQGNIAEFERRILGLDHHTAGKRLAEQWQLPHRLQDCIWLHGSTYDTLPRLDHRRLIGLVSLADLIARRQHLGYSGNFTFKEDPEELAHKIGLDPGKLEGISQRLHEELQKRSQALGLENKPSRELFVQSIHQANQALGRLNSALDRRAMLAAKQTQILEAITAFHAGGAPGRGVLDVINAVAVSAASVLGAGFYAILSPSEGVSDRGAAWLMCQFSDQARPLRAQYIEPPPHAPDLNSIDLHQPLALNLMGILPWIADYLMAAPDLASVHVQPLSCGWGTAALLLHDRATLPPWQQLAPLTTTWGAAIAAASQHEGARRLGEDLAEANGALAEAQDKLLRTESLARLGEMAAGAAHEMNNPLAVISGRGQLLAVTLAGGSREQKAAQTICEQAHRLSDLITSLRLYSDPPKAVRRPTDIGTLLDDALKRVGRERDNASRVPIDLRIKSKIGPIMIDPEQIGQALAELIMNASQAQPKTGVQVVALTDPAEEQLIIQVTDDGIGMDAHTLAHAMDPFFSAESAGRRIGMGLPRAQQLVASHNGWVNLRSNAGQGTTATITLPLDPTA